MTDALINTLQNMTNNDIKWDGNFLGLQPEMVNRNLEKIVTSKNPQIDQLLLSALDDRNRYIAAHVILTLRHCNNFQFDAVSWNGLAVQLLANNTTTFLNNNLVKLKDEWLKRFSV